MGMSEKIKILLIKRNSNVSDLARRLNTKPQNLYNKLGRDNFSENDLREIADALGCRYEGFFFLDNGDKV